ncbi:hypothetical protein HanRHA438_Chr02g0085621 [Helianthus annuus]|nr:hypothetical protein HanIR_Chr02g0086951 [Helianthus annuus]KAJ0777812.1 hypothetical protein HanLR1_Chr02g0064751 [Helianthus annuus]KAJ0786825.1 hypothetical protein HanOQP8_Chr02g0075701 [Helianthus annuus]KAJ0940636.1 hypothetical protein HanRHA438_Chr02g0085621 [Helianthus annuus]KAJ0952405.1 hypothetical protein HanPSC8_Chr02g0071841 [Helianthus annuus]
MEKVQASEERLAKQKADFEAYKRTEQWATAVGHQLVWSLTHLLSEERMLWKEVCWLCQDGQNGRGAHATAKEAEARHEASVKDLEYANVGCAKMAKMIEEFKEDSRKELEACELIIADVNQRLVEAEERATKAEEERDDLATMNANFVINRT